MRRVHTEQDLPVCFHFQLSLYRTTFLFNPHCVEIAVDAAAFYNMGVSAILIYYPSTLKANSCFEGHLASMWRIRVISVNEAFCVCNGDLLRVL